MSVFAELAAAVRVVLPSKGSAQTTVMALPEEWADALAALDLIEQRATELQAQAETAEDDAIERALLDVASEMFPDFDFSGCYDAADLRSCMAGQAGQLREDVEAAEQRATDMEKALERAVYIAERLFQMVPREAWREQGAEWMGQYEGDHHAEQVRQELAVLSAREEQTRPTPADNRGASSPPPREEAQE